MADERIRNLERAASQGDVEAEAKLERVRAGDLDQGRLELAASLGHVAAQAALPVGSAAPLALLRALACSSRECHSRALVALAWGVLPFWEDVWAGNGVGGELRESLVSAQRLLDFPCEEHRTDLYCASLDAERGTGFQPDSREDFLTREVVLNAVGAVLMEESLP